MNATYQVFVPILPGEEREIAIAMLSSLGFNAFDEIPQGFNAYIDEENWSGELLLREMEVLIHLEVNSLSFKKLEPENYNAQWESTLKPVFVNQRVQIQPQGRAPEPGFQYTLQITPKMSFGTGHHPTTRLMILSLPENELRGARVLDLGSGTGILGILAAKMGAHSVRGIDIEEWCTENATENASLNGVAEICHFETGTLDNLSEKATFEVVLANINRNILLELAEKLVSSITKEGFLLLSGFFEDDVAILDPVYSALGMKRISRQVEDRWACLTYKKVH